MKTIKYLSYMLMAALPLSLASCVDEPEYTPGEIPDGAQVFFPVDTPTDYTISEETSISIPVKRVVTDEALTVNILADIDEASSSLFTIPSSVSFDAGAEETALLINFNRDELADGEVYKIGLLLNDEANTTPYGYSELNISITPWAWNLLGTGKYRDDWFTGMWTAPAGAEVDVQIYEHKSTKGLYMVEEMFGWNFMSEFFGGSQDAIIEAGYVKSYTPRNITIDCTDPNDVNIPFQPTGIEDGSSNNLGELYIGMLQGATGTLQDGVITFSTSGLFLGGADGRGLAANASGVFRILLPGYEARDYSLSASYDGMKVASDNKTASAIISFSYGADVTGINYIFVSGNVSSSLAQYAASIVDGTAENIYEVSNFVTGGESVSIEAELTPGLYTVVAVPADVNGVLSAENAVARPFNFPGVSGGEAPECNLKASLYKVSEYPDAAGFTDQCPDYSSILYELTGSDIQSVKMYLNTTDVVNGIEDMGLTIQDVVDSYGSDLSPDFLQELNTTGKTWNIFINLDPSTSYTFVVSAENVYGESTLIVSEPFETAGVPYSGELVVGEYSMTSEFAGKTYSNVFEVQPIQNSETDFLVKNIGINNNSSWYAEYDPEVSTLTLSGIEKGYEDLGNQFGMPYYYYDQEETMYYGFYSYASETSKGKDPCVFAVDPSTKELKTLNNDFCVVLQDVETSKALDFLSYFTAGTEVNLYEVPAGNSSRTAGAEVFMYGQHHYGYNGRVLDPLRNPAGSISRNTDVHKSSTLCVKTNVCEPLPAKPVNGSTVGDVPVQVVR